MACKLLLLFKNILILGDFSFDSKAHNSLQNSLQLYDILLQQHLYINTTYHIIFEVAFSSPE